MRRNKWDIEVEHRDAAIRGIGIRVMGLLSGADGRKTEKATCISEESRNIADAVMGEIRRHYRLTKRPVKGGR